MTSIRGAITAGENTCNSILEATKALLLEVIEANGLSISQIIDITFSATKDLNAVYPAVAARDMGIVEAGLICVQEMDVPGSLPMCIRVLLHAECGKTQPEMMHVFLRGAKILRPELANKTVAIDGPSGAGKSTVARLVAEYAGIMYVDTGAMYRAVAFHNIRLGNDLKDQSIVEDSLKDITIDIQYDSKKQQLLILNDEDVTDDLRTQNVAEGAAIVAAYPTVREKLVYMQRALARKNSVVMDGRDIGTNVLPDADVKIYLSASLEERVRRRMGELQKKGEPAEYEEIKKEIEERDFRDKNRDISPLVKADDSIFIESDNVKAEDIAQLILKEMG